MRHVDFDPDRDLEGDQRQWWDRWLAKAEQATREVLDVWNATNPSHRAEKVHEFVKSKQQIWSDLKSFLLEYVFHKKCAYCEGRFTAGSFNDAEHWRPKAKVTVKDDNGKARTMQCPEGKDHPGYFWLAFEWRNLLPACQKCNSANGKMNQFPTEGQPNCLPGTTTPELDRIEGPLLLHPYSDVEPAVHIEFAAQGVVKPHDGSEKGRMSILVYDLRRGDLDEERASRQEEAEVAFGDALMEAWKRHTDIEESMAKYTGPKATFSTAVKAHIDRRQPHLMRNLQAFFAPQGRLRRPMDP